MGFELGSWEGSPQGFWPAMRAGDVLGVTSPIHLGDRGINGLGPANADRRMLHHGRLYNSYDEKRIA